MPRSCWRCAITARASRRPSSPASSERFERAASIRNYGGLGLGLYFIQAIVDAHGGSVTAENASRRRRALPDHAAAARHRRGRGRRSAAGRRQLTAAGHRIFVVEDEEMIRESLVEFLDENGYEAVGASDGRDALEKLGASSDAPPCLILLDLMMPVMDGRRSASSSCSRRSWRRFRSSLFSAYRDVAKAASEMNAAGHLEKPLRLPELLRQVRRYCTNKARKPADLTSDCGCLTTGCLPPCGRVTGRFAARSAARRPGARTPRRCRSMPDCSAGHLAGAEARLVAAVGVGGQIGRHALVDDRLVGDRRHQVLLVGEVDHRAVGRGDRADWS